jgi:hypothetical protein
MVEGKVATRIPFRIFRVRLVGSWFPQRPSLASTSGVAAGYAGATKGKSKLATMLMLRPLSTVEEAVLVPDVPDVLYSSVFIDRVNL